MPYKLYKCKFVIFENSNCFVASFTITEVSSNIIKLAARLKICSSLFAIPDATAWELKFIAVK